MKRQITKYWVVFLVLLIVLFQFFMMYKIYQLEKQSLRKEINLLLETALKKDVDNRFCFINGSKEVELVIDPNFTPPEGSKIAYYNADLLDVKTDVDYVTLLGDVITDLAYQHRDFDIQNVDSIVGVLLKEKSIHADYTICLTDENNDNPKFSKTDVDTFSPFLIESKSFPINMDETKKIQLLLLNPQRSIFKQIALVIFSSFFFFLLCFYLIRKLQQTISRERKITDTKNELFSHISHELKRPITNIVTATTSMENSKMFLVEEKQKQYLKIIKNSGIQAVRNIDMIMTLAKEEEKMFELIRAEFDLFALAEELVEVLRSTTKKELIVEIENKLISSRVKADKDHISQCILNLMENAVKYSADSVKIVVCLYNDGRYTVISVKDNGWGIPKENLSSIFDQYHRVESYKNKKGFGIGLHYVKTIIQKHSGKVEVESILGEGSEFSVYLPK